MKNKKQFKYKTIYYRIAATIYWIATLSEIVYMYARKKNNQGPASYNMFKTNWMYTQFSCAEKLPNNVHEKS